MKFIIHDESKETSVLCDGYRIHKPALHRPYWALQTFGDETQLISLDHPSYQTPKDLSEEDLELLHNVVTFHLHQMIDQYNGEHDIFHIDVEALVGVTKMMEGVLMLALEEGRKTNLTDEKLVAFLCQCVSFSPPDEKGE